MVVRRGEELKVWRMEDASWRHGMGRTESFWVDDISIYIRRNGISESGKDKKEKEQQLFTAAESSRVGLSQERRKHHMEMQGRKVGSLKLKELSYCC